MTIKTVARRDSATALLRKLGVAQADYAKFITVLADGRVQVDLALAAASVKADVQESAVTAVPQLNAEDTPPKHDADPADPPFEPVVPVLTGDPFAGLKTTPKKPSKKSISVAPTKKAKKPAAKKAAKPKAEPKAPKTPKEAKRTCSTVARELIRAGKTNAEVWEVIQPEFELKDSQKYYPGWYRFELRRKGEQV